MDKVSSRWKLLTNHTLLLPPSIRPSLVGCEAWEDDVLPEGLDTEQRLAQRPAAFPQHVVAAEGDDGAEREDEVVDVLLVQVVPSPATHEE